ncbi:hypothetical protein AB7M47_005559 [Bradyrhizobium elkanii]|jgi:hypothetical protein
MQMCFYVQGKVDAANFCGLQAVCIRKSRICV